MKPLQKAGNNTLFSNSLLIFLTRFFPALATTFIIILFSRQLDEIAYGIYQNFWIQLYLLSTLACMGLQAFLLTYPPSFIAALVKKISPRFYALGLTWMLMNATAFAYLQMDSGFGLWLPCLFLVSYSTGIIVESLLIVLKRLQLAVYINITYTIVFFAAHWLLLKGYLDIQQLFTLILLLSIAKLFVYLAAVTKTLQKIPATEEGDEQSISQVKKLW